MNKKIPQAHHLWDFFLKEHLDKNDQFITFHLTPK